MNTHIRQFSFKVFAYSGQLNNWRPNSDAKVPLNGIQYQDPATAAAKWNFSSLPIIIIIIYTWPPILIFHDVPTWYKHLSWVIWWLLERYTYQNAYIHTQAAFWRLSLDFPHGSDHPGRRLIFTGSMSFVIYTHYNRMNAKGLWWYTWKPQIQALLPMWHTSLSQIKLQIKRQFVQGRVNCTQSASVSEFSWAVCVKVTSAWLLEPKNIAPVSVNILANQRILIGCSESSYSPLFIVALGKIHVLPLVVLRRLRRKASLSAPFIYHHRESAVSIASVPVILANCTTNKQLELMLTTCSSADWIWSIISGEMPQQDAAAS